MTEEEELKLEDYYTCKLEQEQKLLKQFYDTLLYKMAGDINTHDAFQVGIEKAAIKIFNGLLESNHKQLTRRDKLLAKKMKPKTRVDNEHDVW